MSDRIQGTLAIAVVVLVLGSAIGGSVTSISGAADPGFGSPEGTIIVADQQTGVDTNHTWDVPIPDDGDVEAVVLRYNGSAADASAVSAADIESVQFGSETASVASVDWNGTALTVDLEQTVTAEALDDAVVVVGNDSITNPEAAGNATNEFQFVRPDGDVDGVDTNVEFVETTVEISGTVRDASDDTGIDGAPLTVEDERADRTIGIGDTEADGSYTVAVPTNRNVTIEVTPEAYENGSTTVSVGTDPVDNTDFDLDPLTFVEGRVSDETFGDPIPNATVNVEGEEFVDTTTDENGEYRLDLDPGSYTLAIDADGYESTTTSVDLEAGDTPTVDVELTPSETDPATGTVEGTVTDDSGDPIENASVVAQDDEGSLIANVSTSADGTYEFEAEPATFTVGANADGYVGENQTITLEENETETLSFSLSTENGSVAGTVTDAAGTPVEGALVEAVGDDVVATVETDETGSYNLSAAPGTYDLEVDAAGFQSTTATGIEIAAGTTTTENVTLRRPPEFTVAIETVTSPVVAGDPLSVSATVTNEGDLAGTQQVTLEGFDGTEQASTEVSLNGGETTTVDLTWATDAEDAGNGTVTVATENATAAASARIDAPAAVDVDITDAPSSASIGDEFTVEYAVTNDGDVGVNESITFTVDGTTVATDSDVRIGPGETYSGSFAYTPTPADGPSLDVAVATSGDQANRSVDLSETGLRVSSVDVDPRPVEYGETATVTAVIKNTGSTTLNESVDVRVDGSVVANRSVEVDAGGSESVTVEVDTDSLGIERGAADLTVTTSTDERTATLTVRPTLDSYTDEAGGVDTPSLRNAVDDWRTGLADTDLLVTVIDRWQTGAPVQ